MVVPLCVRVSQDIVYGPATLESPEKFPTSPHLVNQKLSVGLRNFNLAQTSQVIFNEV